MEILKTADGTTLIIALIIVERLVDWMVKLLPVFRGKKKSKEDNCEAIKLLTQNFQAHEAENNEHFETLTKNLHKHEIEVHGVINKTLTEIQVGVGKLEKGMEFVVLQLENGMKFAKKG